MESQNLIGVVQASAILGVHRGTFWAWRRTGRINVEPVVKIGPHSLFDEAQIRDLAAKELIDAQ